MLNTGQSYQITSWRLIIVFLNFLFRHAFLIYYTYSYTTIPKELLETSLSIGFLVYIILSYVSNVPTLIELIYTWRHLGEMTTLNLWKSIIPTNHYPLVFVRWATIGALVLGCYFLGKFIPISSDNCDIYAEVSRDACISLQIIVVFTMIVLSLTGLILLILLCMCCCRCCLLLHENGSNFYDVFRSYRRENPIFIGVSNFAAGILPIVTVPPPDKTCVICLQDPVVDEEAAKNEKWMVLNCEHKFHPQCIQVWLSQHNTCPMCRAVQV